MPLGLMSECFGAPDYEVCRAAELATGRDRWPLDVNNYADNENNPYYVGSAAWRALHPEAARALDAYRIAQDDAAAAATTSVTNSGPLPGAGANGAVSLGDAAAPGLIPIAIAALVLLVLARR